MIIHFSSTLIILQVIHRHVQKKFIHIPCFTATESRELIIIVREYSKFVWPRSGLPAQLFGIGKEVVELDGPWELHDCFGPRDEFLRGEYDHDVAFLVNVVMSYSSLSLRITKLFTIAPPCKTRVF